MTVDVKLVKKSTAYNDKNGTEKRGMNFYVQVGDEYIPIAVVFFPNDKCEGRDPAYAQRIAILSAVAEELPPLPPKQNGTQSAQE